MVLLLFCPVGPPDLKHNIRGGKELSVSGTEHSTPSSEYRSGDLLLNYILGGKYDLPFTFSWGLPFRQFGNHNSFSHHPQLPWKQVSVPPLPREPEKSNRRSFQLSWVNMWPSHFGKLFLSIKGNGPQHTFLGFCSYYPSINLTQKPDSKEGWGRHLFQMAFVLQCARMERFFTKRSWDVLLLSQEWEAMLTHTKNIQW